MRTRSAAASPPASRSGPPPRSWPEDPWTRAARSFLSEKERRSREGRSGLGKAEQSVRRSVAGDPALSTPCSKRAAKLSTAVPGPTPTRRTAASAPESTAASAAAGAAPARPRSSAQASAAAGAPAQRASRQPAAAERSAGGTGALSRRAASQRRRQASIACSASAAARAARRRSRRAARAGRAQASTVRASAPARRRGTASRGRPSSSSWRPSESRSCERSRRRAGGATAIARWRSSRAACAWGYAPSRLRCRWCRHSSWSRRCSSSDGAADAEGRPLAASTPVYESSSSPPKKGDGAGA